MKFDTLCETKSFQLLYGFQVVPSATDLIYLDDYQAMTPSLIPCLVQDNSKDNVLNTGAYPKSNEALQYTRGGSAGCTGNRRYTRPILLCDSLSYPFLAMEEILSEAAKKPLEPFGVENDNDDLGYQSK